MNSADIEVPSWLAATGAANVELCIRLKSGFLSVVGADAPTPLLAPLAPSPFSSPSPSPPAALPLPVGPPEPAPAASIVEEVEERIEVASLREFAAAAAGISWVV